MHKSMPFFVQLLYGIVIDYFLHAPEPLTHRMPSKAYIWNAVYTY